MSELKLSDYERGYLRACFDWEQQANYFHESLTSDDTAWFGYMVKNRAFDLRVHLDPDTGHVVGVVFECFENEHGHREPDMTKQLFINEV